MPDLALPRRAVLFDLDGTLVDTVETRIEAWLEALAAAGFPTTRERLAPLIGVDGRRLAREIAALAGVALDDEAADRIDRDSGERYERRNREPGHFPVCARWSRPSTPRHRLGDRHVKPKEQVATSVTALGLMQEPRIVDASHVEHAKPEPDLLLEAAEQLDVEPAHCWYVGDATWDMVAAVAAGMIPIAVTAGSAVDEAALRGAGAAAIVAAQ